jgi:hypothetical protein
LQRLLSMVLVLGLLVATAAAFAITESLKLTKSPITRTFVSQRLSPSCNCPNRAATIRFWLRRRDVLTLSVVDSARNEINRLVDRTSAHSKWNTFVWRGDSSAGRVAPDGAYYVRVGLENAHRTILLPNRIELDTTPPRVLAAEADRDTLTPRADGRLGGVTIHYRLSEPGHALLFVKGQQVVRTRFAPRSGKVTWYGTLNGRMLPQGTYRVVVAAEDLAENVSAVTDRKSVPVHIVYVRLARHELPAVKTRTRFGVGVKTGAPEFTWAFAGRHGVASPGLLVLRAPAAPGGYRLVVGVGGHRDAASVVVVPRR